MKLEVCYWQADQVGQRGQSVKPPENGGAEANQPQAKPNGG